MAFNLPPPPSIGDVNTPEWKRWFFSLQTFLTNLLPVSFTTLDFTGSNLTSIETRNHNDLQSIQGGDVDEYYHLSEDEHTELTDGGDTTLHFHSSDRDLANASGNLSTARLNNGIGANSNTFWRGDGTWAVPDGSGGGGGGSAYEPMVAEGFNTDIPYIDGIYGVPNFITTSNGDVISSLVP
jgi:hypothetical protein